MKQFQRVIWASLLCLPMAMSAQAASGVIGSGVAGTTQDTQGTTSASNAGNTSGTSSYGGAVNNAFSQSNNKESDDTSTKQPSTVVAPDPLQSMTDDANRYVATKADGSGHDYALANQPVEVIKAKQTSLLAIDAYRQALAQSPRDPAAVASAQKNANDAIAAQKKIANDESESVFGMKNKVWNSFK